MKPLKPRVLKVFCTSSYHCLAHLLLLLGYNKNYSDLGSICWMGETFLPIPTCEPLCRVYLRPALWVQDLPTALQRAIRQDRSRGRAHLEQKLAFLFSAAPLCSRPSARLVSACHLVGSSNPDTGGEGSWQKCLIAFKQHGSLWAISHPPCLRAAVRVQQAACHILIFLFSN